MKAADREREVCPQIGGFALLDIGRVVLAYRFAGKVYGAFDEDVLVARQRNGRLPLELSTVRRNLMMWSHH